MVQNAIDQLIPNWSNYPPWGIIGGLYPNLSSLAQRSEQQ